MKPNQKPLNTSKTTKGGHPQKKNVYFRLITLSPSPPPPPSPPHTSGNVVPVKSTDDITSVTNKKGNIFCMGTGWTPTPRANAESNGCLPQDHVRNQHKPLKANQKPSKADQKQQPKTPQTYKLRHRRNVTSHHSFDYINPTLTGVFGSFVTPTKESNL